MSWRFRKSKSWGPFRLNFSKSQNRGARLTSSTRLGPFSFSSTGRINFTLFGFTIPLRKANR